MDILQPTKEFFQGKPYPFRRSSEWLSLRKTILSLAPYCSACGSKHNLNVHHIIPFHLRPDLELQQSNLIVLCENKTLNCHLAFGHLMNWKSYNSKVVEDSAKFLASLLARPLIGKEL